MGGFSPEQLPVLSTLAREFAVFDAWFAGVPSQTYCNRSFFHASTSHGFVTNKHGAGYDKWLDADAGPDDLQRARRRRPLVEGLLRRDAAGLADGRACTLPSLEKYWRTGHFGHMSEFYDDAKAGTLPAYAFIEPRMIYNHNDFHPPVRRVPRSATWTARRSSTPPSRMFARARGSSRDVYDAIKASATPTARTR